MAAERSLAEPKSEAKRLPFLVFSQLLAQLLKGSFGGSFPEWRGWRMTICPFCKNVVLDAHEPCPRCGRRASEHPSLQTQEQGRTLENAWGDDDDLGTGDLDISRGGSVASHSGGASAYAGGGVSFGGDDDPFAEDVPQRALELDLPSHHTANAARSIPADSASLAPMPDLVLPRAQSAPARSERSLPAAPPSDPMQPPAFGHHRTPDYAVAGHAAPAPGGQSAPAQPPASGHHLAGGPSAPPRSAGPSAPLPPSLASAPDPAALIARFPVPPQKVWETPLYMMRVAARQLELRQDLASLRKRRSPDVALYERALKTHDPKTFALGLAITCAALAIASFVFFLPVILRFLRAPD
jgi:hypothetical protein